MLRKAILVLALVTACLAAYLYVPFVSKSVDGAVETVAGWFSKPADSPPQTAAKDSPSSQVADPNNIVFAAELSEPNVPVTHQLEADQGPTRYRYTISDFGYSYDSNRTSPFAFGIQPRSDEVKETKIDIYVAGIVFRPQSRSQSVAILQVTQNPSSVSDRSVSYVEVHVGQNVEGYEVVRIEEDRVVLRTPDGKREIEVSMQ